MTNQRVAEAARLTVHSPISILIPIAAHRSEIEEFVIGASSSALPHCSFSLVLPCREDKEKEGTDGGARWSETRDIPRHIYDQVHKAV